MNKTTLIAAGVAAAAASLQANIIPITTDVDVANAYPIKGHALIEALPTLQPNDWYRQWPNQTTFSTNLFLLNPTHDATFSWLCSGGDRISAVEIYGYYPNYSFQLFAVTSVDQTDGAMNISLPIYSNIYAIVAFGTTPDRSRTLGLLIIALAALGLFQRKLK